MTRTRIIAARSLVLISLASAWGGDAELQFRVVALQGQPAPGTPPGAVFVRFSGPFNNSFPFPGIDAEGNQSLFAILSGSENTGVWSEAGGALSLLARTGQPAPGTEASFAGFPVIEVPAAPLIRAGRSAFAATLVGPGVINTFNSDGIWSDRSGTLQLVVRAADPVPGLPEARFAEAHLAAFNAQGRTLIASRLGGAGVTASNDESLWSDRSGAFTPVAREGQPAPGTEPGVVFGFGQIGAGPSVFTGAVMNDASLIAFDATLAGPNIDSFNDEALYLSSAQGMQLLVREGEDAPGAGHNITFGGNSVQLFVQIHSLTTAGQIAFSVRLGGAIPTTDAVFSTHSGVLTQVVRAGQPAPGTGTSFTLVGGAHLSEAGRIAFQGSTSTGFFPPLGVWWDQHGSIQPLLLPGATPAGLNGATLTGVSGIFGYAASGMILVRAGLNDPEFGQQSALLLVEPNGNVHEIAASGEPFDATGHGDPRIVYIITPGGLSESGEVAFRLRFTDGTEGHYAARLGEACYANCDGSTSAPVLNVSDFTCFLQRYAAGELYANCDNSTQPPVLNVGDFACFLQQYAAGCP
jgi:hypothetical protein